MNLGGNWLCPRCGYILHHRFLFAQNGRISVNPYPEFHRCPNDGEILVPFPEDAE